MIIGIGTDILETDRILRLIQSGGNKFLERWFSPEEIKYCQGKTKPYIHFAARISAKEAIVKAIRMPSGTLITWQSISVEHDQNGAPLAVLSGKVLERSRELGVTTLHLSISHTDQYATATAVAEGIPRA